MGKCTAGGASCRKESGEVHGCLQENGGSARDRWRQALLVHFPIIPAPKKFHARIWGKCTTNCSETGEMNGKPRAVQVEKRSFPAYRCTSFPMCGKCGELCEKGRAGRAGGPVESAEGLTGASTLCGHAAVRRRGEPLPKAGSGMACEARDYRRRAVGEPLRAGDLTERPVGRVRAGLADLPKNYKAPLPSRTPGGVSRFRRVRAPGEQPCGLFSARTGKLQLAPVHASRTISRMRGAQSGTHNLVESLPPEGRRRTPRAGGLSERPVGRVRAGRADLPKNYKAPLPSRTPEGVSRFRRRAAGWRARREITAGGP